MSSPFDLTYLDAQARIADLQATASTSHTPATASRPGGPIARFRDALGARLIDLGASVATDEHLRRQVMRG